MDHFQYTAGKAFCENKALEELATEYGTPLYVYSKATLQRHVSRVKEAFSTYPTTPCFAVKANSNLHILAEIFQQGFGADVVSLGELKRALKAGVTPSKIVYSGVGKQKLEIEAALIAGIRSFNVESDFELEDISRVAEQLGKRAPISLRINPNIDAQTNPKIATGLYSTKFGIDEELAKKLAYHIKKDPNLELVGIACHIGSQITNLSPLKEAANRMADFASSLIEEGFELKYLNMGGGVGIKYKDENPPELEDYAEALIEAVSRTGLELIIEPGRVIAGNTGILLTRVIGVKDNREKKFLIVDGAMNDLLRPSMYDSYHEILSVNEDKPTETYDVVGPICETGDLFGKDRQLPPLKGGDLIFLRACGAYGSAMSSNYNSRPRPAEVLVSQAQAQLIKPRESLEDLWKGEF